MNAIRHLRHLARALAALAAGLLAAIAGTTAAFAVNYPLPADHGQGGVSAPPLPYGHWTGPVYNVPVHTLVIGGMPGWQIALIATAAALVAATAVVLVDRARNARRRPATAAA